jgi:hypothetical protein
MASVKKTANKAAKKAAKKAAATTTKAAKKTAKKAAATTKKAAKKAAKKTAKKAAATTTKAAKKTKKAAKKTAKKVRVKGTRHDPPVLLLVHLPMNLPPMERAEKFEGPLEMALAELGTITGGGTSLDENGQPESCDLEVEVNDIARALPIVRRVLVEAGAVKGTLIARLSSGGEQDIEVLVEL